MLRVMSARLERPPTLKARLARWLPAVLAIAFVLAPYAHEAAHDHRHDGTRTLAAADRCGEALPHAHVHAHANHPTNPADPATPTDDHDPAPTPAPGDCWMAVQFHAPTLPAPASVVTHAAAPPPASPGVAPRVAVARPFDHAITLRGPPARLDLA
jgi:hypothetical protein